MRILIIGASGFIGRHTVNRLKRHSGHDIVATFHMGPPKDQDVAWLHADVTADFELEEVFRFARPEVVLHLAAVADVGTAERNPGHATAVNVSGTSSIARLCDHYGARLVFVSTEYVFGGERGFYHEDEIPNPNTHYGRTKREAELEVARLCRRWSVLRTSIVYGWPDPGKRNFAPWLIDALRHGRPYHAPTDVYRTPIYVEMLTAAIERLVTEDHQGVYHVAGRDWVSMYEFASAIASEFQFDTALVVPTDPTSAERSLAEATRTKGPRSPDLLGLDCNRSMKTLAMEYCGLAEGISALKNAAPSL